MIIGKKYKVKGLDENCFPIWVKCVLVEITGKKDGYDCVIKTLGKHGGLCFCNLEELTESGFTL